MLQKFINKKRGFTLIELLVAIAVASIVIIGSYMSVNQFTKQQNVSSTYLDISQDARMVLEMLKRDIRMAGYKDYQTSHGDILDKLIIADNGDNCCDKLDIIYDKNSSLRIRRTYEVEEKNNIKRLVLTEYSCPNNEQCTSIGSNWSLVSDKAPIIKDIKNIQFLKNSSGGEALYLWSEVKIDNKSLYSLDLSTGETKPLFELPWGEAGKRGTGLTYDKNNKILYFWVDKKIHKMDALTGELLGSFDTIEGEVGSNVVFGNNKIFIWKSNQIFKYNADDGQQEAVFSTEFTYNNTNWQPYSHNGSGQRLAYGNGELYIWFDQARLATFDANNGAFKNMSSTPMIEAVSGSNARSSCRYSNLLFDSSYGLDIMGMKSGRNNTSESVLKANGIGIFEPKDCGSERGCQGHIGIQCGSSMARGKNNIIYIWHGDEVYPFTGSNTGLACDSIPKKYTDCKSPGILTLRASVFPDPNSNWRRDVTAGRGSNMIYIEDTSDPNTYNSNIKIDLTISKFKSINEQNIEKTFTSSVTVRNF